MKATVALNYKFGRKKVDSKKEIGNFYEIGGGKKLSNLVATRLNKDTVGSTIVVICVNLS